MTVSGQSGLFRLVSKGKNSLIVESLENGRRLPVYSNQRANSLEEISVFTLSAELPLKKVLLTIFRQEEGKQVELPSKTEDGKLRDYFKLIVPDHDPLKVYLSDIRKILSWYNQLLLQTNLEWKEDEENGEDNGENAQIPQEDAPETGQ